MSPGYRRRNNRNRYWVMVLVLLFGLFIGGGLAVFISQWEMFSWLSRALEIGTQYPWSFTSPLLSFSLYLTLTFNIGSVIGLVLAFIIYKLVRR